MPSSASVLAPVHASTPPTSHTTSAAPGAGTLVSIAPGDVKTPLPMTMLATMAKASAAPSVRANVVVVVVPPPPPPPGATCVRLRFRPGAVVVPPPAGTGAVVLCRGEERGVHCPAAIGVVG